MYGYRDDTRVNIKRELTLGEFLEKAEMRTELEQYMEIWVEN